MFSLSFSTDLKSCSGDFDSPESDPPHKIMRYWFYDSIWLGFSFPSDRICQVKMIWCTSFEKAFGRDRPLNILPDSWGRTSHGPDSVREGSDFPMCVVTGCGRPKRDSTHFCAKFSDVHVECVRNIALQTRLVECLRFCSTCT